MGWNDRLPEDPYTPPREYYQARDEYEAWLEYIDMRLAEEEQAGLTSQNLDPAALSGTSTPQESQQARGLLPRLWAALFGQNQKKENTGNEEKENPEELVSKIAGGSATEYPF